MPLWEYKVITSGLHGFASPALLEAHLNALGKDEWEILHFQTAPNNPLAFNGLARRVTQRDWTPPIEAAPAAPIKSAYEPVAAPVKAGPATVASSTPAKAETESLASRLGEKQEVVDPNREESLRPMRNTERDLDPDAEEEEDDWNEWEEAEDDLPTLFEALKPHLRRNQKGAGMSVAIDYLAKRWEQREADLIGALKECGFTIPETEETDPDYFEFEGDLYWVNRNNRGQLFINTREKPRAAFRVTPAKKLDPSDPAAIELAAERAVERAEIDKRKAERQERADRQAAAQAAAAAAKENGPAIADQPDAQDAPEAEKSAPDGAAVPLPTGQALLDKIRPLMRRNRRGPGYSGSVGFLARALKNSEADLTAELAALGLNVPANAADKPIYVEITDGVYWMNKDSRGGIWINGREKREGGQKSDGKSDGVESVTPNEVAAAADQTAEIAPGAEIVSSVSAGESSPSSTGQSHASNESSSDQLPLGSPSNEASTHESQVLNGATSAETNPTSADAASTSGPENDSTPAAKAAKPKKPSRPRTRKPKSTSGTPSSDATDAEAPDSEEQPKQD